MGPWRIKPPSTYKISPVIKRAAEETRKITPFAISLTSPISGNGYWSSDAQNPTTNINFSWKMGSVEHTMEKLGYKNLIKNF